MSLNTTRALVLSLLWLLVSATPLAIAQSTLTARWLTEPARTGQANTILIVASDQTDLAGLTVAVVHDDQESALTVTADAGQLSGAFTPPSVGAYSVHVTGSLKGKPIDDRLALTDVQDVTLSLPAIQVEAPEPIPNQTPPGPNWTLIGGIGLSVLLLIAAVVVSRNNR